MIKRVRRDKVTCSCREDLVFNCEPSLVVTHTQQPERYQTSESFSNIVSPWMHVSDE